MAQALTHNERMLRKIRAALEEAIESGTGSATLQGAGGSESYTRLSLAELQGLEKRYMIRVNAERGSADSSLVAPDFGGTN